MLWYRRLNLLTLVLCFSVIVFGAFVRLSDAGLGCPDWPGCYGHLTVPEAQHEVAAAQRNFPQRPLDAHKAWKEMTHRYLASALGLLIVLLALCSRYGGDERLPRRLPWLLVGLVIFQGLLGMWTVTWQLKPLAVCGHLLGGMTTASLLLWMWLTLGDVPPEEAGPEAPSRLARNERQAWTQMQEESEPLASDAIPAPLRRFAALALALLALQIFLGGWTSSNYAALACPDFPTCQGQWLPQTDVKEAFTLWRGLGINYEHGVLDNRARVTIHFFHRAGALAVTLLTALLAFFLLRREQSLWRRLGQLLLGALALQVVLGISIVMLQLPLVLADMHNAGAALLLLTLVAVNYYAYTRR